MQASSLHYSALPLITSLTLTDQPTNLKAYLKKLVGQFTTDLAQTMYSEYSKGTMLQTELKARFSWEIMQFSLNIDRLVWYNCQAYGIHFDNNAMRDLTLNFDTSIRHILEFLIKKYPPSKHKIIDTELARHIT